MSDSLNVDFLHCILGIVDLQVFQNGTIQENGECDKLINSCCMKTLILCPIHFFPLIYPSLSTICYDILPTSILGVLVFEFGSPTDLILQERFPIWAMNDRIGNTHLNLLDLITLTTLGAINKLRHTNFMIFLSLPRPCDRWSHFWDPPIPSVTSHVLQFIK